MLELVHTSAPSGLFDGKAGYAVVAATEGLPTELVGPLSAGSTAAVTRLGRGVDPELFAVYRVWQVVAGLTAVTRIVPIEADYTGRPARLAHHVVLPREEASGAVIAALLANPSTFASAWRGAPCHLPVRPAPTADAARVTGAHPSPLESLTDHAQRWERHLAAEAILARARPLGVLVPSKAPLRAIVASIVRHCEDPSRIRIETSLDHLVSASPSLLLLRDRSARTVGIEVSADWSGARGTVPPPDEAAATPRRTRPVTGTQHDGGPEVETLPQPPAIATTWTGSVTGRHDETPYHEPDDHEAPRQEGGPTPAEALLGYATGVLAGAAAALAARALVP